MSNDQQDKKSFVFNDSVLFDFILLIFFLFIAIGSFEYNPRARAIPAGLGILGSAMMLLQFLSDAIPRVRSKLRFVSQSGLLGGDSQPTQKEPSKTEDDGEPEPKQPSRYNWWQAFRLILWLGGFIVLLSFTNYLLAVGVFIVLITKIEANESWKRALILALCVTICFFILFDIILDVHLD
jgi:hypothetical protein